MGGSNFKGKVREEVQRARKSLGKWLPTILTDSLRFTIGCTPVSSHISVVIATNGLLPSATEMITKEDTTKKSRTNAPSRGAPTPTIGNTSCYPTVTHASIGTYPKISLRNSWSNKSPLEKHIKFVIFRGSQKLKVWVRKVTWSELSQKSKFLMRQCNISQNRNSLRYKIWTTISNPNWDNLV